MNYGYNLAAAGVLTAMYRQDIASNNLANIETAGFKVDYSSTMARPAATQEDGLYDLPSNRLLERLGAGVLLTPTRTAFSQGPLENSTNPLDVAMKGDGFFMVHGMKPSANGGPATREVRLTRDGRMTLDKNGRLVNAASGQSVLDSGQRPITLDPAAGKIAIDRDGTIRQGGQPVGQIGVVDVADRTVLKKEGAGMFSLPAAALSAARPATGDVVQGAVEKSNVDPIQAMMQVTNASNDAAGATRIMSIHDELMSRTINTLGRVS